MLATSCPDNTMNFNLMKLYQHDSLTLKLDSITFWKFKVIGKGEEELKAANSIPIVRYLGHHLTTHNPKLAHNLKYFQKFTNLS